MLLISLLLACKQTGTVEIPNGIPHTDDTAVSTDDSSAPTDDSEVPTDDSDDPGPQPEPDYSIWIGERLLSYDGCEETLVEKGGALDESFEYWDYLVYYCDDCDYWYEIEVSPAEACGFDISTRTYRGVRFDGDQAAIYYASSNGGGALAENGSFDGWTIEYQYSSGDVKLEGVVEYPEL